MESFSFNKIRNNILGDIEDFLDDEYQDKFIGYKVRVFNKGSKITIYPGEGYANDFTPEEYEIEISVDCYKCKKSEIIINRYNFDYEGEFLCEKIKPPITNKFYFDCKVEDEDVSLW